MDLSHHFARRMPAPHHYPELTRSRALHTAKMSPKLLEVQHDSEFAELIEVYRAGFTDPGTKLWPLFSGDYRPDPELQHAALEETTQRLRSYHRSDPTSHWLKVVDDSTGQVIGGGRWCFYETGNPYDGHGTREATWWPEGRPREVASFFMNQFWATRARHMDRPHACKFCSAKCCSRETSSFNEPGKS